MAMNGVFQGLVNDALGNDDALGLSRRLQAGEVSQQELVDAAIARAKAANCLNAIVVERFEQAQQQADGMLLPSDSRRPFAGVPSFIKDNLDVAGLPTGHGSRAVRHKNAATDAPWVSQFRASGLNPLGKTRLPEFGLTASTEYSLTEPARNPWGLNHSCGGSSGGSAALVAAGVVPIAHANDGGGSIRIPAACCGLVGLKPSLGRFEVNPMNQGLPIKLVADGVVSRSVRDTAHFLAALEAQRPNPKMPPIGLVEGAGDRRLRIGFYTQLPDGEEPDASCVAAVETVATLCASLGHDVESMQSPLTPQRADDFLLYWGMLAAALAWAGPVTVARGFQAQNLEPLTWQLARHFRANLAKFPGALWRQKRAPIEEANVCSGYDVILSPTLGHPAPELGYLQPNIDFEDALHRLRRFAAYTPADNVCGTPAMSLPLARNANGLPVGVHFSSALGQERMLLELAYELEGHAPWPLIAGEHAQ